MLTIDEDDESGSIRKLQTKLSDHLKQDATLPEIELGNSVDTIDVKVWRQFLVKSLSLSESDRSWSEEQK